MGVLRENKKFVISGVVLAATLVGAIWFALTIQPYSQQSVGALTKAQIDAKLAAEERVYAHIDANGVVDNVIVIDQATLDTGYWGATTSWIRTSKEGTIRKNYAGIGYKYDSTLDAFIPPKIDTSATLDTVSGKWILPTKIATSS